MFIKFILRKFLLSRKNVKASMKKEEAVPSIQEEFKNYKDANLSEDIEQNLLLFKNVFGESGDIKFHDFYIGDKLKKKAALIYIDGLVNLDQIGISVLEPIVLKESLIVPKGQDMDEIAYIKESVLCNADIEESGKFSDLLSGCLSGSTVFLIDGCASGLLISTKGWSTRNISEPQTELVVRGPREGFTEDFRTNTSLLRRKIKSPAFKMENMIIGRKTLTNVCVAYIEDIAKPELIDLIKTRLEKLDIDSLLDSGYIEEYIEDAPFSIFSTMGSSEKPDVVAAKILEGRVAIIVDGSPFVLTAPYLFIESFHTAEDYYIRPFYANMTRIIRLICYVIAILAVPIYISLITFHQELIPTTLLFTFSSAAEGTPFPVFVEALIMVFSFEVLREAGIRLPRPVGQAIGIVGALIMGEAAVAAGLVGAPMVIVVAITAVAGFAIPGQIESISVLRFLLMALSAMFGGYGIAVGVLIMLVHLASLKSFGADYFAAVIPSINSQDSFLRAPLWAMKKRPYELAYKDKTRRDTFVPPPEE